MQLKSFTTASAALVGWLSLALLLLPLHSSAIAQSLTCDLGSPVLVTFPGHPTGLTAIDSAEAEVVDVRLENLSSTGTLLPMTLVYAVVPVATVEDDVIPADILPIVSGVATTVPALEPAIVYDTTLAVPVNQLPAGTYDVFVHAVFGEVATTSVSYPSPQTRAGSLRVTVEGDTPAVFNEVALSMTGIVRDDGGRAVVTETMTVDATVSIANTLANESLRANILWLVYEGSVPAPARLVESWTEEVRLLPGRDREYQFQFGVSDDTSSVYTLVATLIDQARGQVWSAQEQIYSGDGLDNPTPMVTAAYYSTAGELQVCYGLVTDQSLLPLETEDRVVAIEWTDGLGEVVTTQEWSLHESPFTMTAPVSLPVTVQSLLIERDGELTRTLAQDIFLVGLGCEVGRVCATDAPASSPTLFSMEDGPTSLHYLLITLAGIAVGVLLWLMITRHERERKAYEAARKKQRNT